MFDPFVYANSEEKLPFSEFSDRLQALRAAGKRIVTTNGCFDLLHTGHVTFLEACKSQGDVLIIGLNSDASVAALKGPGKPLVTAHDRARLLTALRSVDYVHVFSDLLPSAWLEAIRPDVHCKAGDYAIADLPEAEIVRRNGGEVRILPFVEGFSTTQLMNRIAASQGDSPAAEGPGVFSSLIAGSNVLRLTALRLAGSVEKAAEMITAAIDSSGKVLVAGNGGSAADAQHFAAELVGRYKKERNAWPAIALTVDSSILTCIGNDYGFSDIFSRQVQAHGKPGDVLVLISTSGKSENLLSAAEAANAIGMSCIALVSERPNPLSPLCALALEVPSQDTPLIQQAHMAMLHVICELVETSLTQEVAR